jgi:hypothetical protein
MCTRLTRQVIVSRQRNLCSDATSENGDPQHRSLLPRHPRR